MAPGRDAPLGAVSVPILPSHRGDASRGERPPEFHGVPVYSLRNLSHHEPAARAIAEGKTFAFYCGLYGIARSVRVTQTGDAAASTYWRIKAGRPRWSKVPLFIKPEHALRLIDPHLVHPGYRHLAQREHFEWLWAAHGGPLHVIAPLKQPLRFLPDAFQTHRDDLTQQTAMDGRQADRLVAHTTASFFWMADVAWESLATLINLYSLPRSFCGMSSFNDHGEHPPYTLGELCAYVGARGDVPFDLIIHDELYEQCGSYSSHTQVRLPLIGEPPELVIVRIGSVGPESLAASTGYPIRVLESASVASRRPGLTAADLEAGIERLRCWRSPWLGG